MNAEPFLAEIARYLHDLRFDVILIDGNFTFRKTATNLRKLKALAGRLDATVLRTYYPRSDKYRLVRDADGLQLTSLQLLKGSERSPLFAAGTKGRKRWRR